MKKLLYISILFIGSSVAFGQVNLVPNPSFEQFTFCPNSWASFDGNVLNWYQLAGGTPDAYDTCGNPFQFGVPQNPYGYQFPMDGNSYTGIGFGFGGSSQNYREYMQVKLTDTLLVSKSYAISFYVSKADSAPIVNTKIGLHLSATNNLSTLPNGVINEIPQVVSPPGFYIQDDVNWIEVSDTITALGDETYITIGYFETDSSADTLRLFNSTPSQILGLGNDANWIAYYYIDNVKVECIDCSNSIETIKTDKKPVIYPNPAVNTFNVKFFESFKSIELLNSNGNIIRTFSNTKCSVSDIEEGIYYVKITDTNRQTTIQKLFIAKN